MTDEERQRLCEDFNNHRLHHQDREEPLLDERRRKLVDDLRQVYRYVNNDEINELIWWAADEIERLAKLVAQSDAEPDTREWDAKRASILAREIWLNQANLNRVMNQDELQRLIQTIFSAQSDAEPDDGHPLLPDDYGKLKPSLDHAIAKHKDVMRSLTSEDQGEAVYDRAWQAILALKELKRARSKLSMHELRLIIRACLAGNAALAQSDAEPDIDRDGIIDTDKDPPPPWTKPYRSL